MCDSVAHKCFLNFAPIITDNQVRRYTYVPNRSFRTYLSSTEGDLSSFPSFLIFLFESFLPKSGILSPETRARARLLYTTQRICYTQRRICHINGNALARIPFHGSACESHELKKVRGLQDSTDPRERIETRVDRSSSSGALGRHPTRQTRWQIVMFSRRLRRSDREPATFRIARDSPVRRALPTGRCLYLRLSFSSRARESCPLVSCLSLFLSRVPRPLADYSATAVP